MVVFRDVLRLDEGTAREVKGWAARALVRAALDESRSRAGGSRRAASGGPTSSGPSTVAPPP